MGLSLLNRSSSLERLHRPFRRASWQKSLQKSFTQTFGRFQSDRKVCRKVLPRHSVVFRVTEKFAEKFYPDIRSFSEWPASRTSLRRAKSWTRRPRSGRAKATCGSAPSAAKPISRNWRRSVKELFYYVHTYQYVWSLFLVFNLQWNNEFDFLCHKFRSSGLNTWVEDHNL
jgi:hypothetical protein